MTKTNAELAGEIAPEIKPEAIDLFTKRISLALSISQWQQIIAALRRGPEHPRVPVCGASPLTVSRAIWDEAWIAYAKKYGASRDERQHDRLLREGFYAQELDELRPGWRPVEQRIAELERPPSGEITEAMQDAARGILQAIRYNPGVTEHQVYQHCKLRGDSTKGLHENDGSYVTEARAAAMIYRAMLSAAAEAEGRKS